MARTPKATVRLTAWELAAIQHALESQGEPYSPEMVALIEKIANAKLK
jgi:hypothetical protein